MLILLIPTGIQIGMIQLMESANIRDQRPVAVDGIPIGSLLYFPRPILLQPPPPPLRTHLSQNWSHQLKKKIQKPLASS